MKLPLKNPEAPNIFGHTVPIDSQHLAEAEPMPPLRLAPRPMSEREQALPQEQALCRLRGGECHRREARRVMCVVLF